MKKDKTIQNEKFDYNVVPSTISATECTGLMPYLPETYDEADNEMELYGVIPPEKTKK